MQAESWTISIEAFVYVTVGWALLCLIVSPYVAYWEERKLGRWVGTRFLFDEPLLVAISDRTWQDDGKTCVIDFPFVEPNSLIDFSVELDPPVGVRASCSIDPTPNLMRKIASQIKLKTPDGEVRGSHKGSGIGSCRLSGRRGYLAVSLERETIPVVSRVYIRAFDVGSDNRLIRA